MPLDIDVLLEPVEGDLPAGPDLRADYTPQSVYYRLRDARSDARSAERAADAEPALEGEVTQHWRNVTQLSQTALGKARDLEVAAWVTEALVRADGLGGLEQGARLIDGLARGFWDGVYPLPDEDGMETRVLPISGMNGVGGDGTLIQPLRKLPLFNTPDGEPVMLFQYQQSEETAGLGDISRKEARLAAGVADFAKLETAARAAGVAHFTALARTASATLQAWQAMAATLDEMAGADAPPTRRVAEILEQIIDIAKRYAPSALESDTAPDDAVVASGSAADGSEGSTGGGVVAGQTALGARARPITREDALKQLAEVAEFFRKNEPQSPISLTLDEASRRARLPWPELIEDIMNDSDVRRAMLTALGIKPPSDSQSED